jgi:hypothetical protein
MVAPRLPAPSVKVRLACTSLEQRSGSKPLEPSARAGPQAKGLSQRPKALSRSVMRLGGSPLQRGARSTIPGRCVTKQDDSMPPQRLARRSANFCISGTKGALVAHKEKKYA